MLQIKLFDTQDKTFEHEFNYWSKNNPLYQIMQLQALGAPGSETLMVVYADVGAKVQAPKPLIQPVKGVLS